MLISIQFLRAIASILVLTNHIAHKDDQYAYGILNFFSIGGIGVDIFFIISGFIMMHSTHQKPITAMRFILLRVIRVIPLYWILTIVALVIYMVMPEKVNSSGGETHILESFFLLPVEGKYLIQNGWTLAYEFLFYFIFMVGIFLKNNNITIFIIILLGIFGLYLDNENYYVRFFTNTLLIEFLFGIFLFHIYNTFKLDKIILAIFLIIISAISFYVLNELEYTIKYRFILTGIPALFFSLGILLLENKLKEYSKYILLLGNSSYSLYLIHPFILVAVSMCFKYIGINTLSLEILFILSMFISSILAGIFTYNLIEINISKYLKEKVF